MSVDTQRVQEFMIRVFFTLTVPLQIVMSLIIIYFYVGASVFTGFVLLVLLIPFNGFVAGLQIYVPSSLMRRSSFDTS